MSIVGFGIIVSMMIAFTIMAVIYDSKRNDK